jgi:hypothetical protein
MFTASCSGCSVTVNGSNVMEMSPQIFSITITSDNTMAVTGVTLSARGQQGNPAESNPFTLNPSPPPPATKLNVVTSPTSQTAGLSFSVTVTAQDVNGNTATTFHGDGTITATMNGSPSHYLPSR